MKRHISIFAFLLGAFVAGFAFEARAAQTVYGGYCYSGRQYRDDLRDKHMKVNDSFMPVTLSTPGDKAVCTATEPDGMRIADKGWGYVKSQDSSATLNVMVFDNLTWEAKSSSEYEWKYDGISSGYVAIAVRFDYIAYTLKFVSSQGGTMPADIATTYDVANTIPAPSSAPIGYHFDKWIATSSFDKKYRGEFETGDEVSGEDFGLAECHEDRTTVTLTAQWAADTYAVSSVGENGTVSVATSADYDKDLTINWTPDGAWVKPTVKIYAGTDDKGTLIKTYSSLPEETVSTTFKMSDLNAYYENIFVKVSYDVYTITYNGNGGFFSNPMETSVTRRIENNTRISEFPEVHWDGDRMSLKGWYRAAGSEIEVNIGDPYDFGMDMEFYAKWDPSSTFNISGEVLPSGAGRIEGTNSYVKGKAVMLTAFPANGYSFVEWRRGDVRITDSTYLEVTVEGDAHYTAFFTGNVYKVTFWSMGGVPTKEQKQVTYGSEYGSLPHAVWATPEDDLELEGWYTEPEGQGERVQSNTVVTIVGNQNLYANWKPIPTYHVAYNGNGSTSDPMPNQKMYCGVADNLTSNKYERIGYHFRGWATNTADAAALKIAYADGALVTDIASTNETVTLYAAWEVILLGEAMHCNDPNLAWKSSSGNSGNTNPWFTAFGEQIGDGTDSCVRQKGGDSQQWLVAQVSANGSLSFSWKPTGCDGPLTFWIGPKENQFEDFVDLTGEDGSWSTFSTNGIPAGSWIHLYFYSDAGTCDIDRMTWMPGGPEPEDGKDNVTISSAAVLDGKFVLSFESKAEFDYNLLTNADLLVDSWGVMGEKKSGDGKSLTFEPEIIEGLPQLFYKVETIQRK